MRAPDVRAEPQAFPWQVPEWFQSSPEREPPVVEAEPQAEPVGEEVQRVEELVEALEREEPPRELVLERGPERGRAWVERERVPASVELEPV